LEVIAYGIPRGRVGLDSSCETLRHLLSEDVSRPARPRDIPYDYGWFMALRVSERERASVEKQKYTTEYTLRHPLALLESEHVVLGGVAVSCLSLVDPGLTFSKFRYQTRKSEHFVTPTILS
jgi:hypothetical protein